MSSPPSKPSNLSNYNDKDQAVLAAKHKPMSDEEVQLLHPNTDQEQEEEDESLEIKLLKQTKTTWYTSAPFLWYISASTICPLIIIITVFTMEAETPFSLAFVLGIINSIFGACYFFPHLVLKDHLIESYAENQKKRMHTDRVRGDIKKLTKAASELAQTRQNLVNANKETKTLLKNLRVVNVDSMEELNESKAKAKKLYREWHGQLLRKERVLLHTLYDRYEWMDNSPGMNEEEFNQFLKGLPDGYAERLQRLGTFDKLSKGDGLINYGDFKSALDIFAEMEVNDEDIDFEIERKETGTDEAGNKQYVKEVVKKSKRSRLKAMNNWFTKSVSIGFEPQ